MAGVANHGKLTAPSTQGLACTPSSEAEGDLQAHQGCVAPQTKCGVAMKHKPMCNQGWNVRTDNLTGTHSRGRWEKGYRSQNGYQRLYQRMHGTSPPKRGPIGPDKPNTHPTSTNVGKPVRPPHLRSGNKLLLYRSCKILFLSE